MFGPMRYRSNRLSSLLWNARAASPTHFDMKVCIELTSLHSHDVQMFLGYVARLCSISWIKWYWSLHRSNFFSKFSWVDELLNGLVTVWEFICFTNCQFCIMMQAIALRSLDALGHSNWHTGRWDPFGTWRVVIHRSNASGEFSCI